MGRLGWLTWASLKTGMGFLEQLPWAQATPHPYTLTTSPTDAAVLPSVALEQVNQEITSVQRTLVGPEAPGPSAGDQASPGPGGAPTLQEASPWPPGTEVLKESGEAQQWADHKAPPVPRLIPGADPNLGHGVCPPHESELAEPWGS